LTRKIEAFFLRFFSLKESPSLRWSPKFGQVVKRHSAAFDIPPGWRVLVIAKGWLFEEYNLMHADRDGVLCPKHFQELDSFLGI